MDRRARAPAATAALPSSSPAARSKPEWILDNRRRRPLVDLKQQSEDARAAFEMYGSDPDDDPVIAPKTRYKREYIMREWIKYWENGKGEENLNANWMDPDEIWYGLCRDDLQAQRCCKVFWRGFLLNSARCFPVLDLERPQLEYEERLSVTSAITLLIHWRSLVAQANNVVLSTKRLAERRAGRGNPQFWSLTFRDDKSSVKKGPIYEISKWIVHSLAREFGLASEIMVEKQEATDEDVLLISETLWERADDILCDGDTRLSFNGRLIIMALVGCRRGVLQNFTYGDVKLAYVRDPRDKSRMRLIASIELCRNKRRRAKLLASKSKTIRFAVTLVPYKPICLASIIFARAIAKDAFDTRVCFKSAEALLCQPNLEDSDYVPLPWKKEFLDQQVFDLGDATFDRLWHRCCLVAGLRKRERLYTLRVGAACRLDGSLSNCLRNYIMDQSTNVFEGYYQPKNVRTGLAELAFGRRAGDSDDALFDVLRKASLRRDPGAPIYVSKEYSDLIESRSDMRRLLEDSHRARIAGDDESAERLRKSRLNLERHLLRLALTQQREDYFDRADELRLNGRSTADLSSQQPKRPSGVTGANTSQQLTADIARFMRFMRSTWERDPNAVLDDQMTSQQHTKTYVDLLVRLQTSQPGEPWAPPASEEHQRETATTPQPTWASQGLDIHNSTWDPPGSDSRKPQGQSLQCDSEDAGAKVPRCLVCQFTPFNRSGLTRHYSIHVKEGYFDRPFQCPECCRLGLKDVWIETGKSEYSSHVEKVHGKLHAPFFPSYPLASGHDGIWCIICDRKFNKTSGLTRHCRDTHAKKEKLFDEPYQCPACGRGGNNNGEDGDSEENRTTSDRVVVYGGVEAWIEHIRVFHGESAIRALPPRASDTFGRKRKRTYDDPSEPTTEAIGITDEYRKRPKTYSLDSEFDCRYDSADYQYSDVTEERTAAEGTAIQTVCAPAGLSASSTRCSPDFDALSQIDPALLYGSLAVHP